MRKTIFLRTIMLVAIAFLFVSTTGSSRKVKYDFTGTWVYGSKQNAQIDGSIYFCLTLKQVEGKITGTYCSYSGKMARIDCNSSNKVYGSVKKKTATLVFESAEWGGGGEVTLKPAGNDEIIWHITAEKRTGNADFGHWAPSNIKLKKSPK